jgi:hypothetical protein
LTLDGGPGKNEAKPLRSAAACLSLTGFEKTNRRLTGGRSPARMKMGAPVQAQAGRARLYRLSVASYQLSVISYQLLADGRLAATAMKFLLARP